MKRSIGISICFFIYISTFIGINYFVLRYAGWADGNFAKSGVFGDSFGVANAFFSGAAFVGVAIAIYYQHQELRLQRHALDVQETELEEARAGAARAEESQRFMMEKQSLLVEHTQALAQVMTCGYAMQAAASLRDNCNPHSPEKEYLEYSYVKSRIRYEMMVDRYAPEHQCDWVSHLRDSIKKLLLLVDQEQDRDRSLSETKQSATRGTVIASVWMSIRVWHELLINCGKKSLADQIGPTANMVRSLFEMSRESVDSLNPDCYSIAKVCLDQIARIVEQHAALVFTPQPDQGGPDVHSRNPE